MAPPITRANSPQRVSSRPQKSPHSCISICPTHHRILVSPATRTQQTASALTHHFTLAPTIAPGASAEAVLHAARWPDAGGTVLIVGHQPTLGEVAAQLLGCADATLSIKKGAIWWFSQREGSAQVTLRLVIYAGSFMHQQGSSCLNLRNSATR